MFATLEENGRLQPVGALPDGHTAYLPHRRSTTVYLDRDVRPFEVVAKVHQTNPDEGRGFLLSASEQSELIYLYEPARRSCVNDGQGRTTEVQRSLCRAIIPHDPSN